MKNKLEPEALNSIIEQLEQMLGDVEKKIYRPQGTFNECNLIKIDAHNGSSFSELSRFTFPQYYLSYDNESVKISYQLEDGFYNPIELPFLNKELEDNFLQEFHLNNSRQATQKDIELIAKCTGHAAEIKRKKAYLDYLNQVPERHKKKNKNANFSSRPLTQLEYEFERKDVQQAIDYLKWLLSVVKKIKGQENESELYGMYKQRVQYFFLDREDAYFDTSFSIFNANYKPNQLYIKLLNLTVDTNYFQDIEKILSTFDRLQFLQIESHDIKTKRISFTLKSFEIQDIARLSEEKELSRSILEDCILFDHILIPVSYLKRLKARNIIDLADFFKKRGLLDQFQSALLAHPDDKLKNIAHNLYKFREFKSPKQAISDLIEEMKRHGTQNITDFEHTQPPPESFYHHLTIFCSYLDNLPSKTRLALMDLPGEHVANLEILLQTLFSQQDKCIDVISKQLIEFLEKNKGRAVLNEIPQYSEEELKSEISSVNLANNPMVPINSFFKLPFAGFGILETYKDNPSFFTHKLPKTLDQSQKRHIKEIINFFISFHPKNYPGIANFFLDSLELNGIKLTPDYIKELVGFFPYKNQKMQFLEGIMDYKKTKLLNATLTYSGIENYLHIDLVDFLINMYRDEFGSKVEFIKFLNILDVIQAEQIEPLLDFIADENQQIEFMQWIAENHSKLLKNPKLKEIMSSEKYKILNKKSLDLDNLDFNNKDAPEQTLAGEFRAEPASTFNEEVNRSNKLATNLLSEQENLKQNDDVRQEVNIIDKVDDVDEESRENLQPEEDQVDMNSKNGEKKEDPKPEVALKAEENLEQKFEKTDKERYSEKFEELKLLSLIIKNPKIEQTLTQFLKQVKNLENEMPFPKLYEILERTNSLLYNSNTAKDYKVYVKNNILQGKPSTGKKILGGIMMTLGTLVAAVGVVLISTGVASNIGIGGAGIAGSSIIFAKGLSFFKGEGLYKAMKDISAIAEKKDNVSKGPKSFK